MKRKTTKEILAESFRELAEKKGVDKITIREITENCGFSPATFYRHFKDKYNLIVWDFDQRCRRITDRIGSDGYTWSQVLLDGPEMVYGQKEYVKNLLNHTSGQDSFSKNFAHINISLLTREILKSPDLKKLNTELEICIKVYSYGIVQIVCDWISGKIKISPEHLAVLLEQALPEPLKPYLGKMR